MLNNIILDEPKNAKRQLVTPVGGFRIPNKKEPLKSLKDVNGSSQIKKAHPKPRGFLTHKPLRRHFLRSELWHRGRIKKGICGSPISVPGGGSACGESMVVGRHSHVILVEHIRDIHVYIIFFIWFIGDIHIHRNHAYPNMLHVTMYGRFSYKYHVCFG